MRNNMHPYLVDILRCPWDRSVLRIDDAVLRCSGCDRKYPIDRGIPRFIDPEVLCKEQVGELAARDFTRKPIALRIDDLPEFDAICSALSHRKIKVGLDAGSGAGKVTPVLANAEQTIAMDF